MSANTYEQEVAPAHDANQRAVQNPLDDLSGLEKFVADNLPDGSVQDEETRAQITQRLLDNENETLIVDRMEVD